MNISSPIGVFDSGYGGLTVLKEIIKKLPGYDYLYLGDNARAPYGIRSFDTVYEYTLQCVSWLLHQGCPLVILACNTASAKALRTIQQKDLPGINGGKRVLGVIRPTVEVLGNFTKTQNVGILGTKGTVQSGSYVIELKKLFPSMNVYQQACPMWVPLVENNEMDNAGAEFFIKKYLKALLHRCDEIDTILLACTHYPLLEHRIRDVAPGTINIISQGKIVAESLADYLYRHPEINNQCSKNGTMNFYTTDATEDFDKHGEIFFGQKLSSAHLALPH
ncbi:glutamate racemase [soil metagenome]